MFSHRGDCGLFLHKNDGTVELASELDYRAQAEAERGIGFDEDHNSILTSPGFFEYYQRTLNVK